MTEHCPGVWTIAFTHKLISKSGFLVNYKLSGLSSLNPIISHISIKCIIEYDYR